MRLTILYLVSGLVLIVALGAGTFLLLSRYFETTTDLALQHRIARAFRDASIPLPPDLAAADNAYYNDPGSLWPLPGFGRPPPRSRDDDHKSGDDRSSDDKRTIRYDGDLSAIFLFTLDDKGNTLNAPAASPPIAPDPAAVQVALSAGPDFRTVQNEDGESIRLISYRVPGSPVVFQAGRALNDQNRILSQLVLVQVVLGSVAMLLVSAGSWAVAGRALQSDRHAWERQQDFVANASHELRTPLTFIRASTEFARRGLPPEDERSQLLDDVLQECDYMSKLTSDLLLLSRLDAKQVRFEPRRVSVAAMVAELERQISRIAAEKQITIQTSISGDQATVDDVRLRQVLLILLDNALRYTGEGGKVTLRIAVTRGQLTANVSDTGIGIPPDHLARIFDRFYRVDASRNARTGGTGLGLALAKGLLEAQGGHIKIASHPGGGTEATISLPIHN